MTASATKSSRRIYLNAETAEDLMTAEPVTIPEDATLKEAVALLIDRRISAAPVVDAHRRAIGVVSRSDIVEHDREDVEFARRAPDYYTQRDLTRNAGEELPAGFQVEQVDRTRVRDIMTPAVFAVRPDAPVDEVIRQLLVLDVHRLFVVDESGVLLGVVTSMDIVRKLSS
jgi:CBS domain-containing protein